MATTSTGKAEPQGATAGAAGWMLAVAAMLLAAQWLLARQAGQWTHASVHTIGDVMPLVLLLGVPALAGLLVAPLLVRLGGSSRALVTMLAAGLLMRLVWLGAPAPLEDDFYRYLWDGAVAVAGYNPYALAPEEIAAGAPVPARLLALAAEGKDAFARINHPGLTTIYPGLAQLAFALAHVIAPFELDGLRVVLLAADVASLGLLLRILAGLGRPPILAALYWLNPLVVWSSLGTAHSDALLPPFLLGACLAAWQGRHVVAALSLAGAVGVKIWPVLLLPLIGRLLLARGAVLLPCIVFGAVAGLLLLPLGLGALQGQRSGLLAYSDVWWGNNAPYSWVSYGLLGAFDGSKAAQRILRLGLAVAAGLVALAMARTPPASLRDLLARATVVAAALFYLSPTELPWYALWFLPFAAGLECRPLLLASATLATYYLAFPLAHQGLGYVHGYYVALLHALPVWAWLVYARRYSGAPAAVVAAVPGPVAGSSQGSSSVSQ